MKGEMPNHEEIILRILSEAPEPLYSPEIADRLNHELRLEQAYFPLEVVERMQTMGEQVVEVSEWSLDAETADTLSLRSIFLTDDAVIRDTLNTSLQQAVRIGQQVRKDRRHNPLFSA